MAKKTNLASALQNASGKASIKKSATISERKTKPISIKNSPINTPPSRQGKKAITGFFDPIVSRQLKQLALDEDKTVQLLMSEALNDLFIKHNHKPIA